MAAWRAGGPREPALKASRWPSQLVAGQARRSGRRKYHPGDCHGVDGADTDNGLRVDSIDRSPSSLNLSGPDARLLSVYVSHRVSNIHSAGPSQAIGGAMGSFHLNFRGAAGVLTRWHVFSFSSILSRLSSGLDTAPDSEAGPRESRLDLGRG